MQVATLISIFSWIITGSVAGYVASLILKAERQGCILNIIIGIGGAIVGAFIISNFFPALRDLFGTGPLAGFLNGIFHAIFGAVILLILAEIVLPGQQIGTRGEGGRRGRRRR